MPGTTSSTSQWNLGPHQHEDQALNPHDVQEHIRHVTPGNAGTYQARNPRISRNISFHPSLSSPKQGHPYFLVTLFAERDLLSLEVSARAQALKVWRLFDAAKEKRMTLQSAGLS